MWKLCQFDLESKRHHWNTSSLLYKKKFSVKEDPIFEEAGVFWHSHARSTDVAAQSAHKKSTTKQ